MLASPYAPVARRDYVFTNFDNCIHVKPLENKFVDTKKLK